VRAFAPVLDFPFETSDFRFQRGEQRARHAVAFWFESPARDHGRGYTAKPKRLQAAGDSGSVAWRRCDSSPQVCPHSSAPEPLPRLGELALSVFTRSPWYLQGDARGHLRLTHVEGCAARTEKAERPSRFGGGLDLHEAEGRYAGRHGLYSVAGYTAGHFVPKYLLLCSTFTTPVDEGVDDLCRLPRPRRSCGDAPGTGAALALF